MILVKAIAASMSNNIPAFAAPQLFFNGFAGV